MILVPRLTSKNLNKLPSWSRLHVTKRDSFWFQKLFSDEKRFTLDVSDGYNYYWHDIRTDVDWFFKWQ